MENTKTNKLLTKTDVLTFEKELKEFRKKVKSEAKWRKERGFNHTHLLLTLKEIDNLSLDIRDRFDHIT